MSQVIDYSDYRARNVGADFSAKAHETLDPLDWKSFRKQAHHMLDDMLDYTMSPASSLLLRLPSAPAWRSGWRW
jgi:hypothetical protein